MQDFEILVVGDGCSDDSERVVAAFGDPRIRWHNLERNHASQWAANNHAVANARGDWIAYLGHDDIWYPTHLEAVLRTAGRADAEVVTSVMVIYGPSGSGVRGVAGLFPSGTLSAKDFVPPSAFAHARDALRGTIAWRDPSTLSAPVDVAFTHELVAACRNVASTRELTVFKFNAGYRRDAYKTKNVDDQAAMIARIEKGVDFRQDELIDLSESFVAGKFVSYRVPDFANVEPGALMRRGLRFKGVARKFGEDELVRIDRPHRFNLDEPQMHFEWHGLAQDPTHGSYRWSGPNAQASVDLPVLVDRDLRLKVKLLKTAVPPREITLAIAGRRLETAHRIEEDRTIVLEADLRLGQPAVADGELAVTIDTGRTLRPIDSGSSKDARWLGAAVCWVEVSPLELAEPLRLAPSPARRPSPGRA